MADDDDLHLNKIEALGRFAASIAHDFNNVLSAVLGHAWVIGEALPPEHEVRADAAAIVAAVGRAQRLTRQLLAFARKDPIEPRVLEPATELATIVTTIKRLLREDIVVEMTMPPRLSRVWLDPAQLEQIVMNLAVNARDAMPEGGTLRITGRNVDLPGSGTSELEHLPPGRYVEIAVADNGIGIPHNVQSRVFDPFFTTKPTGSGTGLGLATVLAITRQAGGEVTVSSVPGQGTVFRVLLPRAPVPQAVTLPNLQPEPDVSGSETILVVDDDEDVRAVVRRILHAAGYMVLDANGPGEALIALEQHRGPVHLALCDVVLPRMRGTALADRLAGIRPGMKALFMSGQGFEHERGAHFLAKPFTPTALLRKVRDLLDESST